MAPANSYAARLQQIAHLQVPEAEAEGCGARYHATAASLLRRLGRDVGRRVALLDYSSTFTRSTSTRPSSKPRPRRDRAPRHLDALTGLYDRGYFEHELRRELQRCQRYGNPVSLLMLDLDEFKEINDDTDTGLGTRCCWRSAS